MQILMVVEKKSFNNYIFFSVVFNYFFVSCTLKLCGEKMDNYTLPF